MCYHMHANSLGVQKRMLDPLELQVQGVVSTHHWVLGTEVRLALRVVAHAWLGMVTQAFNSNTQETEKRGSLLVCVQPTEQVPGQPG